MTISFTSRITRHWTAVYEDSVSEQVVHWPKKEQKKAFLENVFANSAFDVKRFDVKHLIN
jgi:hypothetical protein